MHTVILFFIINSIVADSFPKNHLKSISELEVNLFHTINAKLKNTMNKLFTSLEINKNFINRDIVQLLTKMHSNLQTQAENNNAIYKNIQVNSKVDTYNETVKALFNLQEVFEELFPEKYLILDNNTIVEDVLFNKRESNVKNLTLIENNSTSEESLQFVKDFLIKIDKLTLEDIIVLANSTEERNFTKIKHKIRRYNNLKAWRAPNSSNEVPNARRIYSGKRTMVKKYPFMASIHMMDEFVCAGSIISKDLVLTAATCMHIAYNNNLYHTRPSSLKVRVGSDYTQRFGELVPIIEVYFHPSYDPVHLSNNLAVGRMAKHLTFKEMNHKIRRIDYERAKSALTKDKKEITILGWGDKDVNLRDNYEHLTLAHLKMYDLDDCKQIYSREYVSDTNVCAGFVQKGSGACNRDVGGPGVMKDILVGVVSFGPPVCGTPDGPTVFTKVAYYAEWIDSIVNQEPLPPTVAETQTKPSTQYRKSTVKSNILTIETDNEMKPRSIPKGFELLGNFLSQLLFEGNGSVTEANDYLYDIRDFEKEAFMQEDDTQTIPNITRGIFIMEDIITTNPMASTMTTEATTSLFDAHYTGVTLDDAVLKEIYNIKDMIAPFFTPDLRLGDSKKKTTKINIYKATLQSTSSVLVKEIDIRNKSNGILREKMIDYNDKNSPVSSEISDNYEDNQTPVIKHGEYSDEGLSIPLKKAHKSDEMQPRQADAQHKKVKNARNVTANIDDIVFLILDSTKTTKKSLRNRFREIKHRKEAKTTRMVKWESYRKSSFIDLQDERNKMVTLEVDRAVPSDSEQEDVILRNTMMAAYNDEDIPEEHRNKNDKKIETSAEKRKKSFLDYINIF